MSLLLTKFVPYFRQNLASEIFQEGLVQVQVSLEKTGVQNGSEDVEVIDGQIHTIVDGSGAVADVEAGVPECVQHLLGELLRPGSDLFRQEK